MAEIRLEATSNLDDLAAEIARVNERLRKLEATAESLRGEKIDFDSEPAVEDLDRLVREFKRLEAQFDRAERAVNFARVRSELTGTEEDARQLARANVRLAASGRQLIDFAEKLPPQLRRGSRAMEEIRERTERARRSFDRLKETRGGIGQLIQSLGQLRAGAAAVLAALGIQQLIRFGRTLVTVGQRAIETKTQFDTLIPSLRAFVGSTARAEEVSDQLAGIADRLKTTLGPLIPLYNRLTASGKEVGLAQRELADLFEQTLLSGRAFGLGAGEISLALNAISQVAAKGVASMEELRRQLSERIPNAIPAAAKGLGITIPEAIARISSGSLDAATTLRALTTGLRELNAEAGKAQLNTLRGDIGAFQREAEKAFRTLADNLTPGFRELIRVSTELLATNKEVIASIGQLASRGLAALASALETVGDGFAAVQNAAQQAAPFLAKFTDSNDLATRAVANLVVALSGISGQAEEQFDKAEKAVRKFVTGFESLEEIEDQFRETFQASAEAAGIAAEDIQQTEKELAGALGEIFEESVETRKRLLENLTAAAERQGGIRKSQLQALMLNLVELEKERVEATQKLEAELVESTRIASEARLEAERATEAERQALAEEAIERARELAARRAEAAQAGADEIADIERDLQEKLRELQEETAEKLRDSKADETEIVAEAEERTVELVQEAQEKIREEMQKRVEAAEKVAEAITEAEKRIRDAREESLDQLRELLRENESRAGEDTALAAAADDAEALAGSVADARAELERLLDPGTIGESPGAIIAAGQAEAKALLGQTTEALGQFGEAASDSAEGLGEASEASERLLELVEAFADRGADAFATFGDVSQETIESILRDFEEVGRSGTASADDIDRFLNQIQEAFATAGAPIDEFSSSAVDSLRKVAEEGTDAQQKLAELRAEAEKLQGDIIDPEQPARVQELGTAAGTAAEPVRLLAEGAGTMATASATLAEQLPIVQAALPPIQESITGILGVLSESEVDFPALAAGVAALQEPLDTISISLTAIDETTTALPEKLTALQESAAPLFEGVLEAADDERFQRIAAGLVAMQEGATPLPEPLDAIKAALVELADRKDDIAATLEVTRTGLLGIGAEDVLEALDGLIGDLSELQDVLEIVSRVSSEILSTWQEITDLLPGLVSQVESYGEALSLASNAQDEARVRGDELAETLGIVRDTTGEAVTELVRFESEAAPALGKAADEAARLLETLLAIPAAAAAAAAATAQISVGDGA